MQTPDVIQRGLSCPSCGGQRVYDPDLQALTCQSCGTPESLFTSEDRKAARERPFNPLAPAEEKEVHTGRHVHACQACGGEIAFVGPALSERCPYCDGPVVIGPEDSGYDAMALIPFQVTRETAIENVKRWIKKRWAAPDDLDDALSRARIAGLYAPFWTFDSREAVDYWARYNVRRGKKTVTKHVQGHLKITFDDLLVPASPHITPLIRDGILHEFDPFSLKPFRPGYLAGFAAERHHQTVTEGLDANRRDKDVLIRNRIKRHGGKMGTKVSRYLTDTTGIHYRRILLPVWMFHYDYEGKPMKVVVSAIDGRTYGERPFSTRKLALFSALLTAATFAFGVFWGAAGFY